jgi:hypothetical protein
MPSDPTLFANSISFVRLEYDIRFFFFGEVFAKPPFGELSLVLIFPSLDQLHTTKESLHEDDTYDAKKWCSVSIRFIIAWSVGAESFDTLGAFDGLDDPGDSDDS